MKKTLAAASFSALLAIVASSTSSGFANWNTKYWADDSKEGSILFTREGVLNLKKFIAEKSCPNIF